MVTGVVRINRVITLAGVIGAWLMCGALAEAEEIVYPSKDGTLADGGGYGPFNGIADDADWYFDNSSYEGTITLSTEMPESNLEHRVVWEYDLSGVTIPPPVSAALTFTIRGVAVYPFPDVDVHVYSYPADLQETLDDFHAGPAVLQGGVTIVPSQDPTVYGLDVSNVVNEALQSGEAGVAFRFQIDPDTPHDRNQAFIDAVDSNPTTKPFLTIEEAGAVPGDFDGDGDSDLDDFVHWSACMTGPAERACAEDCEPFDFDTDGDVDLKDFAGLQKVERLVGRAGEESIR